MKICLVVDDTRLDRMIGKRLVEKLGLVVAEAEDGVSALEYCSVGMPDCILLDWEMRGMNGLAFLEQLRAMDQGENVYVIMCTSHYGSDHVSQAYVKGANSYIPKPIMPENLEKTLREGGLISMANAS